MFNLTRNITARVALKALLVAFVSHTAACSNETSSPGATRLKYGASQSLGDGTARTYAALDAKGDIISIGIALSETALNGLPMTPMPGMPSAVMLSLAMPAEAAGSGFNHVMLDWNPMGHEPETIYTLPHFDFHFFHITPAERDAIVPSDPQWAEKAGNLPPTQFTPSGYVAGHILANMPAADAAVPLMGMHWLSTSSPELQPPPNNKPFTRTFIYGTWGGKYIFAEPMITKAYIESRKTATDDGSLDIGYASQVQAPGLYPTKYSVKYDASAKEYRISLDGLVKRS